MLGTTRQWLAGGHTGTTTSLVRIMLIGTVLLAGCGGGSGESTPPGPTTDELTRARLTSISSIVEVPGNRVILQWYDTFAPRASRYQIEKQNADGSWSAIDGVFGGFAPEHQLQWTGSLDQPTTFRVEVVLPNYTIPLALSDGSNSTTGLTVAPPDPTPTVQIDQPQPLAWDANVTLTSQASGCG